MQSARYVDNSLLVELASYNVAMSRPKPFDDFIKEYVGKKPQATNQEIADALNKLGYKYTQEAVRHRRRDMGLSGFRLLVEGASLEPENIPYAWVKTDGLSAMVHNPLYKKGDEQDGLKEAIEEIKGHAPRYPNIEREILIDPHLMIVNLTDVHIGENTEVAYARALVAVENAICSGRMFSLEKIVFIGGNDILHVDNPNYTTTKGTQLQGDRSWPEMFEVARRLYVELLEKLLRIADVHYMHVLSNHDEVMGWTLSQTMQAWFNKCQHITFDVSHEPRKYFVYGDNLLAFTHGHGMKENDLPLAIATEAHASWGKTRHRFCYMGHVHHSKALFTKSVKEKSGIELIWLRSSQEVNEYERRQGYITSAGVSTFIHHPTQGQVARFNTNF